MYSDRRPRERPVSRSQNDCGYPRDRTVCDLVAEQAARTPQAVAVRARDRSLSYVELEARAGSLAGHLSALGVGRGARVGVCMERTVDTVTALLAVMKSGAAYVPLDPTYPAGRLALMVEDAGCSLVLTERDAAAALSADVVCLAVDEMDLSGDGVQTLACARPEDLAYVIYTSGSTGRPKGVEVRHRGVVNLLYAMRGLIGAGPADRWLAVTTISFDISVLEIFLPLVFGAQVILADRADATDGSRLRALIAETGATILQATPVTWRLLIDAGWRGADMTLLCGGEAIDPPLAGRLLEHGGGRFWNVYGPTETTIWSTACEVTTASERIPIGRPLANTQLHILDAEGRPVAPGEAGELFIGGDGVARGYLGRPDLTAERFVADPFAGDPSARMYRTGDRARWRTDGQVDFLGRVDHQVKVRGHRIEPGEIEARLAAHPDVAQAVVIAHPDPDGDSRLIAFVTPRGGRLPDVAILKRFVGEALPAHMTPAQVMVLADMPLTPNGKVDRLALAATIPRVLDGDKAAMAPRTPLEADLVKLFEGVLFVRPIGVHEDFFALGGTSLRAVRLVSAIERRLGRRIHVNTLYHRASTVAALATLLSQPTRDLDPTHLMALGGRIDDGVSAPVFCLHTLVEGTVFFYDPLARRLAAQELFLAVLPRGLHDGGEADGDMAAMADHCAAVIRGRQPQGPYRLLGFSSGGVLALKTAERLAAGGAQVGFVGMIDSYRPGGATTWRYALEIARDRMERFGDRLRNRVMRALHARVISGDGSSSRLRARHRIAAKAHRPDAYDGAVDLFVSAQTTRMFKAHGLGWGELLTDLRVEVLPGSHYTIVNAPLVEELASRVERRLAAGPVSAPARPIDAHGL